VAVFDDDGTLALEPTTLQTYTSPTPTFDAFVVSAVLPELLCAMYNQPYKLDGVTEIKLLIKIADFYCALP